MGGSSVNRVSTCITALFFLIAVTLGCTDSPSPTREKVTLGLALQPVSALALIMLEQGYFSAEGLEVTIKEYVSGKRALAGMLAGAVDMAIVATEPIVFNSFARKDFRFVATIGSADNIPRIIARGDRGITKPEDVHGERIATQVMSASSAAI